nr:MULTISPECIES: hypothetical protein [unclassified Endozoicomonas]
MTVTFGAALVALIHDDQVKEVGRELPEDVMLFFLARHRLVKHPAKASVLW